MYIFQAFYRRHERWIPIAFFALGFVIDLVTLQRIDEWSTILQQAGCLILAGILVGLELVEGARPIQPPRLIRRFWLYREAALHFLLGILLSSYVIFFFKSAGSLTAWIFVLLLIGLMTLNEFMRFGRSPARIHSAFWSLCLISFFVSLVPILLGFIGAIPFLLAVALTLLVFAGFRRALEKLAVPAVAIRRQFAAPFMAVQILFAGLYFARAIPPVPLSVAYMGIFHDVKKQDGRYHLTFTRPWWKFWQNGDQSFLARPGDLIYCFARIYSPTHFKEQLQVRWLVHDQERGWQSSDAIPLTVEGGRQAGYRGVTLKKNYQPGDWKVQIETADGRVVGHIRFRLEIDSTLEERIPQTIMQ